MSGDLGYPGEEDVLPGHQHVVEDEQCIYLVELGSDRVVPGVLAYGQGGAADQLQALGVHGGDESHCVVLHGLVPLAYGGLDEALVGVAGGRLVFSAPHHDAVVPLIHHVEKHVRVLLLGGTASIALGVRVAADVEKVQVHQSLDVALHVFGEQGIEAPQHADVIVHGPQLTYGVVTHPLHHASDLIQHRLYISSLGHQVLLSPGKFEGAAGPGPVSPLEGQHLLELVLELHVVHAGPNVDYRFEGRVLRDVLDQFAVVVDLSAVPDRLSILFSSPQSHGLPRIKGFKRGSAGCRIVCCDNG